MRELPMIDEEPLSCSLAAWEVPARLALFGELRDTLVGVSRRGDELTLAFPVEEAIVSLVRGFVAQESSCCRFWTFRVEETDETLALRWSGPAVAGPLIDRLEAFFSGGEQEFSLSGLL